MKSVIITQGYVPFLFLKEVQPRLLKKHEGLLKRSGVKMVLKAYEDVSIIVYLNNDVLKNLLFQ